MTKTDRLAALIAAVEAGGHSVFAPSAAHRWFVCPASLRASLQAHADLIDEDGSPVTGSNFYSVEGTAAHDVAQQWLTGGRRPDERVGETFERDGIAVTIDTEMLDSVGDYVDYVAAILGDIRRVETRVDMSDLFPLPSQGGTADCIIYDRTSGVLHIVDLKYGRGVRVFATENHQLMLYAHGAVRYLQQHVLAADEDVLHIVVHIVQPRLEHLDKWEFSPHRLAHFTWEVQQRAALAWSDDAPYSPDPKACRFCPVRSSCRALAEQAQRMADVAFGDDPPSETDQIEAHAKRLTLDEKAAILRWRPTIESWFGAIYADALASAEAGDTVPGWKIGEGRRSYAWRNPETVADFLEVLGLPHDEIYESPSVRSPAQIKKVLRKFGLKGPKTITGLLEVTSGKRALVPLIDPRAGLAGLADVFREEDDDDAL